MGVNGEISKKRFGVAIVLFPLVGYLFLFFLVSPVLNFFENVYEINLSLIFFVIGKYILPIIWFVATIVFIILNRFKGTAVFFIVNLIINLAVFGMLYLFMNMFGAIKI